MSDGIKEQSLKVLFRVEKREKQAEAAPAAPSAPGASRGTQGAAQTRSQFTASSTTPGALMQASMGALTYSGPSEDGSATVRRGDGAATAPGGSGAAAKPEADGSTFPGTAKNSPCPCGSGKKYKALPRQERGLSARGLR
ncbi:hypothetical protein GCM10025876_27370 [Demequina litorisediminis]|uniref:Uncharacterized protein n=2 Tax=Demequina litorisediminis TaxID=1849022 RepID=A0ABQ6IF70_9MICO|nr:hypothetical protein GCM10025876_27370 [Demequina litorisediminis]